MKRCIICGNLGDDNSTVCEVCGNPYMDLDDDTPDRAEAGVEPGQEPGIPEGWELGQEAAAAEEVEAQKEITEAEEIEEKPAAPKIPVPGQPAQATRPGSGDSSVRRMSSPQIYGQVDGQSTRGQTQTDRAYRAVNGNGRPASHQPTAGARRPVTGQNRPVNHQGQAMQNRPVNHQGQAMQNHPINGQGPVMMQSRPVNAPQYAARTMGFQNTKIREMSKRSFRSPLFLLIALLQTVYLAGSIAAIFMKQLNFSQIMRLITGVSMPTQITGYMDQLLKLMAKLDTGAAAVNLVIRIPDILMCLGLWLIVFAARSKKEEMPGGGFTLLKIVVIIGLIKSCVLMLAGLVISVALVVSAWVSAVQSMIVAAAVTLVIMIVLTMLVVMYYFSYLAMLRTFCTNTQTGESYGAASGYVAVIYILMGLSGVIGLLSGIVNGEISGIVGSAGRIGWMLLMAFWIFRYRSTLGEIED